MQETGKVEQDAKPQTPRFENTVIVQSCAPNFLVEDGVEDDTVSSHSDSSDFEWIQRMVLERLPSLASSACPSEFEDDEMRRQVYRFTAGHNEFVPLCTPSNQIDAFLSENAPQGHEIFEYTENFVNYFLIESTDVLKQFFRGCHKMFLGDAVDLFKRFSLVGCGYYETENCSDIFEKFELPVRTPAAGKVAWVENDRWEIIAIKYTTVAPA